jgi:hypothetical protein
MQVSPNGGSLNAAERAVIEHSEDLRSAKKELGRLPTSRGGPLPYGSAGPVCTVDQGAYTVDFDTKHTTFTFDYVEAGRDGGVWSEMDVTVGLPLSDPGFRARVNLIQGTSRTDAVKQLTSRFRDGNLDWAGMMEMASRWVVDRFRRGEPAMLLRDALAEDEEQVMPLLPPLVVGDGATILFGDGGSAKSFLGLALAASLHTGTEVIRGLHPTTSKRVLFLDWEWQAKPHARRLMRLMGPDLPDLAYARCASPMKHERDRIRQLIREHHAEFIVIDSVGLACGGEPEDAATAIGFFNILSGFGLDSLCIAHVTKSDANAESAKFPFGSQFWHNSARKTWFIRPQREANSDRLAVALYNRKSNDGAEDAPFGLHFTFGQRVTIERSQLLNMPEFAATTPIRMRITQVLRSGAMPLHVIASELDEDREAVRIALKRGEGQSFIKQSGADGIYVWGLIQNPDPA